MSAQHFRESLIHWLEYLQVNVRITHVNNNLLLNNLLLIRRKYLYEYIQMRLTSYIKIIIK